MGYETNRNKNWGDEMPKAEKTALTASYHPSAVLRVISALRKYRAVTTKMLHNINNDGEVNKAVLTNFARELDEVEKELRYEEYI